MLPGVAFSNRSMTSFSFNSDANLVILGQPPLFLERKFKFKLTRTLTVFGDPMIQFFINIHIYLFSCYKELYHGNITQVNCCQCNGHLSV